MSEVRWGASQWVVLLFFSVLLLLPFSRLAEMPVLILALWGLMRLLRAPGAIWAQPALQAFTQVYLLYLLMVVMSALDSYWMQKSWTVAAASVRFWLMGLVVIPALQNKKARDLLLQCVGWLMMFWLLDAAWQFIHGSDMFGRAGHPQRLTGVFGNHVKLGPTMAALMPFYLLWVSRFNAWLRWIGVLAYVAVVILAGSRSGWLMMLFVLLLFWWHHVQGRRWLLLFKAAMLGLSLVLVMWLVSSDFRARVDRSLAVWEGGAVSLDFALADRTPIWHSALNMIRSHPINGVGAHAFRKAYPSHAAADDVWVNGGGVGLHAHHWLLEVIAETGFLGLLLFAGMVLGVWRWCMTHSGGLQWPAAAGLGAAFLPIVSTYSMFASFWSLCIWWLAVVLFAGADDA